LIIAAAIIEAVETTLRVTEVFRSLQGESRFAGLPCAFVRLTGCALRCVWCDSAYAFEGGVDRSVAEVVTEVLALGVPLVEITGGEPLEQAAFHPLASALLERGLTVLVETGGHLPIDDVDPRVIKVLDVKCPGSGMESANHLANLGFLTERDEVKFVIADRADFDWALAMVKERALDERCGVLFSPVFEGDRSPLAPSLAEWVRDSGRKIRLNLQIHKLLWGDVPGR
jgi:7-carboxy-7-deazaguanine synthase